MYQRSILLLLALLPTLFTAACNSQERDKLHGSILLWHSWNEVGTETLERLIDEFQAIHPQTRIITVAVPPEQLLNRYQNTAQLGLGPDLLLAPNSWIPELATAKLIRPLPPEALETIEFIPAAAATLNYKGKHYGLPFSMSPSVLYVNTELVPQPATTLDELLAEAKVDKTIGLNINFDAAYWGIQTVGDGLFNEDGTLNLFDSGLEPWLQWLAEARETPGMILTRDNEVLRQLFTQGELAYYAGEPEALPTFRAALNTADEDGKIVERVAIYPLPGGEAGPSGPIMVTQVFLFSPASTTQQAETVLALASFLTSAEQGVALMRSLELAPANRKTRVNPRIYPISSNVYRQGETAVTLSAELDTEVWIQAGNAMIAAVLSGEMETHEAMCQFGETLSEKTVLEVDLSECSGGNNE